MTRVVQGTATMFRKNHVEPNKKMLDEALKGVKEFFDTRHYMEKFKYRIYSIPSTNSIVYEMHEKLDKLSLIAFKGAFAAIVGAQVEKTTEKYKEENENGDDYSESGS